MEGAGAKGSIRDWVLHRPRGQEGLGWSEVGSQFLLVVLGSERDSGGTPGPLILGHSVEDVVGSSVLVPPALAKAVLLSRVSRTMGLLPPSAVPQGSQLLLQPSEESINITFICRVSNNLGTAQATIKVLLPGPGSGAGGSSREQSRSRLALTIFPIVVMAMVVGILIYFQCSRKSGQCLLSGIFPTHLLGLHLLEP